MSETNDAAARVAIAEFEQRQLQRKLAQRARRRRTIAAALRSLLFIGAGVYLQVTHQSLSGTQVCGLLAVFLAIGVWQDHILEERVWALEAELARVKADAEKNR